MAIFTVHIRGMVGPQDNNNDKPVMEKKLSFKSDANSEQTITKLIAQSIQ